MESVIDLSPTMQRRMNFEHDLLDDANDYRCAAEDATSRDQVILGYMWYVKDIVMRYRAHWPETRRFTDDMVSVGFEALTKYANEHFGVDWDDNVLQRSIVSRVSDYVNDNRAIVSASRSTNARRLRAGEPLEYEFAKRYRDNVGTSDEGYTYVDILDSIERLAETDKEQMRDLILMFLEQDHDIDEASLSDEERRAVEKLAEIGKELI